MKAPKIKVRKTRALTTLAAMRQVSKTAVVKKRAAMTQVLTTLVVTNLRVRKPAVTKVLVRTAAPKKEREMTLVEMSLDRVKIQAARTVPPKIEVLKTEPVTKQVAMRQALKTPVSTIWASRRRV